MREDAGICRREMADRLSMTLNGYGKIERGEVEVTVRRLCQIAEIVNVPVQKFFDSDKMTYKQGVELRKFNREHGLSDNEANFDPFQYIEFLESRINYLKSLLNGTLE